MPVFKLAEIAGQIQGKMHGDASLEITGIAEIDKAQKGDITFLANPN